MGLITSLMGLVACSSDESSEAPITSSQQELSLAISASAMPYDDGVESRGTTRSWTAPEGYYLYNDLFSGSYANDVSLERSAIDVFLTHNDDTLNTPNPLHARLRYSPAPPPSTSKWKLVLPNTLEEDTVKTGTYYVYGFIPKDAADSATIRKHPSYTHYEEGAELTIHGLKAVATDPCVIIGAKEGPDSLTDRGLKAGDFSFYLQRGTITVEDKQVPKPNYLYLLFDHLYSALSISMRVQGDYYDLRRIKLKELYLKTKTTDGTTPEKTDVTIRLKRTPDKSNPIETITYTPSVDLTKSDSTVYRNSEGFPLLTTYITFLGHFMPQSVSTLILTCVYDVYDTNGNLIRKNCKATNTMLLSELLSGQTVSKRGWKYAVNLTINPTYLYMLSDPDLDNPTVVVE